MNASQMREKFLDKYPNRFSVPGPFEIKQYIQTLFKNSKKENVDEEEGETRVPKEEERWVEDLSCLFALKPELQPKHLYELFIKSYKGKRNGRMPHVDDVKTKIASLRQQ